MVKLLDVLLDEEVKGDHDILAMGPFIYPPRPVASRFATRTHIVAKKFARLFRVARYIRIAEFRSSKYTKALFEFKFKFKKILERLLFKYLC